MRNTNLFIILIVLFSLSFTSTYGEKLVIEEKGNKKNEIKSVGAGCFPPTASRYLEFNNVRALIQNGGDMWWDFSKAQYEVPKGGGVHALFAGSIWVGGKDTNGQLRFAGHKFRQEGVDYYPGPLVARGPNQGNVTSEICTRYDRIYYVTKNMVSRFIAYSQSENPDIEFPNYDVPEVITNWPAHGPTEGQYDYYLAPYKDVDGNGEYNPIGGGDYPYYILGDDEYNCNSVPERNADSLTNSTMELFGDATLWWVYNDRGNIHGETGGSPIGMEFRAQAFAFATNDELNNMTFYNYQVINRSTFTLRDAFFGVWTDADLGYSDDDFVGCDIKKGLGYLYNGDATDDVDAGNSPGYGTNPPAVGVDFFEGPYKDATGKDDLSSYKPNGYELDCENGWVDIDGDGFTDSIKGYNPDVVMNGNINGLNFGDEVADNERWGMRRFLFFNRTNGDYGDPTVAADYYRYLTGFWKNGKRMTYGGTGHDDNPLEADFMFPALSDQECWWGTGGVPPADDMQNWTEQSAGNQPFDRRFVQAAGPFTLEPGNVNDITTGVVWARSFEGDPFASVEKVVNADDKAQTLFEQCFQLIDGPDAPELSFVEMDNKVIIHLSNPPSSNNYLEGYVQADPFLGNYEDDEYRFQGYQIYQVKEPTVSLEDLSDPNFAKVVYQCDLKDDVEDLVNWEFNKDINGHEPEVMVEAANNGIGHTIEVTVDQFATGDNKQLINNREYYFVGIAYAYNEFKPYIQTDTAYLDGQKTPYLPSRKGVNGEIRIKEVIPHPNNMTNGGTEINADYGDQPAVTRIEGQGNARRYLKLADGVEDSILTNDLDLHLNVPYKAGYGPLNVKIVDPFEVKPGTYYVGISPDTLNPDHYFSSPVLGDGNTMADFAGAQIIDSKWFLARQPLVGDTLDTLAVSPNYISNKNEIVFDTLGISIEMELYESPLVLSLKSTFQHLKGTSENNGYIGSAFTFEKDEYPWLDFVTDQEGDNYLNWIRSGSQIYDDPGQNQFSDISQWNDPDQTYEGVLFGKWAPYRLASHSKHGPSDGLVSWNSWKTNPEGVPIPSVNIVFTKDKSKWTRVPVLEMSENSFDEDIGTFNPNSEGNVLKFDFRAARSLDKDGNPTPQGVTEASTDPNDPNFVSPTGWSWFPGYAVDVNKGQRLNMAFGESSWLIGYNGRDMLWNPVNTVISSDGNVVMGGKHFIYVFGAETNPSQNNISMAPYSEDEGEGVFFLRDSLEADFTQYFKFVQWTAIPITRDKYRFDTYEEFINNDSIGDARVELRVAKPYIKGVLEDSVENPMNDNYPLYKFTLDEFVPKTNQKSVAEDALDDIKITPNPYYAGNKYELAPLDYIVKLINLPETCSIDIYNLAGTLVRSFEKDNSSTILTWDLKNNYRVPIAGGMYIIHVKVPGIGEKTLKWFGVLRPDDMSSF